MTVDEASFEQLMKEQKQRARDARKNAGAEAWDDGGVQLDVEKPNLWVMTPFAATRKSRPW